MKLAVIAANGRTGRTFVEVALSAGHSVRAGVHSSHHLNPHPRLEIVSVDAMNDKDLRGLIKGQDAVASFLGHVRGSAADVQTVAMQRLLPVMKELGLTRIVSLTGTGVRFPGDKITLTDRFLNFSIALIDPDRVRDGRDHVAVLQASTLDWTVIRILKLQNVAVKPFRLRVHGPTKPYVGRQEVAEATLQVLTQSSFLRQAPIIGKP